MELCKRDSPEWYAPGAIAWKPWQVVWLLRNLQALRESVYPPDPEESEGRSKGSHHAPFETVILIREELLRRVRKAGRPGFMAVAHYSYNAEPEWVAEMYNISTETAVRLIYSGVQRCSGKRRRRGK
jgi:hypothetical protein